MNNNMNDNMNDNIYAKYEELANQSMVFSILAIIFWTVPIANIVLGVLAIVFASKLPREMRKGKAKTGMVVGIIAICVSIVYTIVIAIILLSVFLKFDGFINDYYDNRNDDYLINEDYDAEYYDDYEDYYNGNDEFFSDYDINDFENYYDNDVNGIENEIITEELPNKEES